MTSASLWNNHKGTETAQYANIPLFQQTAQYANIPLFQQTARYANIPLFQQTAGYANFPLFKVRQQYKLHHAHDIYPQTGILHSDLHLT
jgi:hypothetical protein